MMKYVYYTSEKGIFVSTDSFDYNGKRTCQKDKKYNGKDPETTHHSGWLFVPNEKELTSVQKKVIGQLINPRWELRDENDPIVKKLELPKVLSPEEAHEYYDNEDDFEWYMGSECQYKSVSNLYTRVQDRAPDTYQDEECDIVHLGEIQFEQTKRPSDIKYNVFRSNWKHEGTKELDITQAATYDELTTMLVPDILLHNHPCKLSSKQTYNIVRKYVLDNINSQVAHVTSDYEFCFTVKKKLRIKPYTRKVEVYKNNLKSYKPPRFKDATTTFKEIEVFEMTNATDKYRNYTIIEGFRGDNLQELVDNVKRYLDDLMEYINAPLCECEHCNGTGHVMQEKFEMNKRGE